MSVGHSLLERYRPGHSLLHRLDPRPKLVVSLALIVAITATPPDAWPILAFFGTLILAAIIVSRIPIVPLLKSALLLIPFVLVALPTIFTRPGETLFQFGILSWTISGTREGLAFFLSVLIKAVMSITVASILATTTPFQDIAAAIRFLRVPDLLVAIVSSTYRYLFVLVEEAGRINRARLSRNAKASGKSGGTVIWRAKIAGNMIGSLFLRTYERSERIYWAMASRGFDGEVRTLTQPRLSHAAWASTGFFLLLLLGVAIVARIAW